MILRELLACLLLYSLAQQRADANVLLLYSLVVDVATLKDQKQPKSIATMPECHDTELGLSPLTQVPVQGGEVTATVMLTPLLSSGP